VDRWTAVRQGEKDSSMCGILRMPRAASACGGTG
jgi:hypothetical protein